MASDIQHVIIFGPPGAGKSTQAALLVQHAPPVVADAFCASRLGSTNHHHYGTLPRGVDCAALIARATPQCDA